MLRDSFKNLGAVSIVDDVARRVGGCFFCTHGTLVCPYKYVGVLLIQEESKSPIASMAFE